jgi:cell pole-organizing protein PopZ
MVDDAAATDIFDLTEAMEAPVSKVVGFRTVEGQQDVVFDSPDDEPDEDESPPPPPRGPRHQPARESVAQAREQFADYNDTREDLLSPTTTAAVDSAFNALAHTVLVQNARTLDDLVREMLRPMLKAWLDDNLPNMVERMIRAEIERVSRGR